MDDLSRQSDRILSDGRALLRDNREGGRHRRQPSIGQASAQLKRQNVKARVKTVAFAIAAIWLAGGIVGAILNGIGILGFLALIIATVVAVPLIGSFQRLKTPTRADIPRGGDVQSLVGRTQLWLEAQRPALPAPAVALVDQLGSQLDGLGYQLDGLDQNHPKAREIRELVGEQLPEIVDSYRKIPPRMRKEQRAGSTPDEQLTQSLKTIGGEIDSITRQLAEGSLDDLAIKHRYLDYKFGSGADAAPLLENRKDEN